MAVNSGYELTAYFNTGFNGVDIPAEPAVLELAQKTVYTDNYFLREDLDRPSIIVNDTYNNLKECDYVKLTPKTGNSGGTTCYYFCVPSALAHKTTLLALELDALLTMGGAKNLNYISGWQERGHISTADDEAFSFIAPENFAPRKPLIVRGGENDIDITTHANDDVSLIVSTVDLTETSTNDEVDVITGVDSLGEEKMYFPQIKVNDNTHITAFKEITSWQEGQSPMGSLYKLPSTTAFLYSASDVKEGLKALYSAGQLSLMAAYVIPKEYLQTAAIVVFSDKTSAIQDITGAFEKISPSGNDFMYEYPVSNYTVKNKKTFTMFNQYQLVNVASGGSSLKEAYDLYKTGDTAPSVLLWCDPSPNGKPMGRFSYIKDSANIFADVVYGAPWYQQQLVFEGASGSLWNSINAAFNNANLNRAAQENKLLQQYTGAQYNRDIARMEYDSGYAAKSTMIDLAFGAARGIASAAGDIASGNIKGATWGAVDLAQQSINSAREIGNIATQFAMNKADKDAQQAYNAATQGLAKRAIEQQINENSIGLLKNNAIISPTVLFTPTDNLALYGLNKFKAYHITLDDSDVIELDKYFQRYGYNGIHRPLEASCFTCRQYYTFVQAFDVNIKSSFGMRIRQKAISQLNGGVRVWRVLPDAQYYDTN